MYSNNLETLIDDISDQCNTILDQVQSEILDPNDAINKLQRLYRDISNEVIL